MSAEGKISIEGPRSSSRSAINRSGTVSEAVCPKSRPSVPGPLGLLKTSGSSPRLSLSVLLLLLVDERGSIRGGMLLSLLLLSLGGGESQCAWCMPRIRYT